MLGGSLIGHNFLLLKDFGPYMIFINVCVITRHLINRSFDFNAFGFRGTLLQQFSWKFY
jgi:hypothetical protein